MQAVEAVQQSFIAHIWEAKELNYWDRLQMLGLYSHQRRRERYRIIYTLRDLCQTPLPLTQK